LQKNKEDSGEILKRIHEKIAEVEMEIKSYEEGKIGGDLENNHFGVKYESLCHEILDILDYLSIFWKTLFSVDSRDDSVKHNYNANIIHTIIIFIQQIIKKSEFTSPHLAFLNSVIRFFQEFLRWSCFEINGLKNVLSYFIPDIQNSVPCHVLDLLHFKFRPLMVFFFF
jgi:hypothetical protein